MDTAQDEALEAVRSGDVARLTELLVAEPQVAKARTEDGVPLLHLAAGRDDIRIADLVLEAGADVGAEAPWGQTAFEWAANMGATETALLLRRRGAARHNLWTAAALGRIDEVEEWFEHGRVRPGAGRIPPAGADLSGWPPDAPYRTGDAVSDAFYIACRNGHLDVARFLRGRGADVGATGYFGATALHWAAINGHVGVTLWLIEAGADLHLRDRRFDSTPAGWAREGGHTELASRLVPPGGP